MKYESNLLGNIQRRVLGSDWGIQINVCTLLGLHKDVTLVLVLTHCENICPPNYANAPKVVSTFYLTRGRGTAQAGGELLA